MKITAPLSRLEEIEPLVAAGADEFYCSVVPTDWQQQFGSSAVSRRLFGNLANDSDLELAIERVQGLGKQLSLVMNAQHYTSEQLDSLLRLAERFAHRGGDAVIVGDPTLLGLIGAEGFDFGIHLSSIAACRNRQSADFFRELGATRIIFPRDMTLKEMARMTNALPELEFEAFVLNDGCVFEEGVCHSIHLPGPMGGAICMDNYRYRYLRDDAAPLTTQEQQALEHNDSRYAQWLWYRFGCGFSVTKAGYPYGPCGICALPRLNQPNFVSVKIAGRDAPLVRKEKSVALVRQVLDRMASGAAEAEVMDFAQGIRGDPELCSHGKMCYYPEVVNRAGPATGSRVIARG